MIRMVWPLVFVLLLALGGCATAPQTDEPDEDVAEEDEAERDEERARDEDEGEDADTMAAEDCPPTCDFARDAIDDPSGLLAERTIYFEFDSSDVEQEYMEIIERHAAYLSQHPDMAVRLEGHTDERGSREYNIGLGDRRANAVQDLLQAYGTDSDQTRTISYGEEMPAEQGSNEDAWSKNRRVELVYPSAGDN